MRAAGPSPAAKHPRCLGSLGNEPPMNGDEVPHMVFVGPFPGTQLPVIRMRPRASILTLEELHGLCEADGRAEPVSVPLRGWYPCPGETYPGRSPGGAILYERLRAERAFFDRFWTPECDQVVRRVIQDSGVQAKVALPRALSQLWGKEALLEMRRQFVILEGRDKVSIWALTVENYWTPGLENCWQTALTNYAMVRAQDLSVAYQHYVRLCLYCDEEFRDDCDYGRCSRKAIAAIGSYPEFCPDCLEWAFASLDFGTPLVKDGLSTDADFLAAALRALCQVVQAVVPSDFVRFALEMLRHGYTESNPLIAALIQMQPTEVYTAVFGQWLDALKAAGLVSADAARGTYGIRCLAADGHQCESLAEKNIDDWLWRHGVPHERAPGYPHSTLEADWAVGDALVEYWGIGGVEDYDAKAEAKRAIARSAGIRLIEIGPEDLYNPNSALREKFAEWL